MTTAQTEAPTLVSRLADWLVSESIASAGTAPDIAERIITAAGEDTVSGWLGTGSQALTDAAKGIAALASLGDAGWAAEDYWHGHRERRPR